MAVTGLLLITLVIQRIEGPVLLNKEIGLIEFLKETKSFHFELVVQIISVIPFFSQPVLRSSFKRLGRTCDFFFFKYPGVFFQAWAARGSMHSYFRM